MSLEDQDIDILNKLCAEHSEFKFLFEKHIRFEQDLEALYSIKFFTPEVEIKIKEIKKLKLYGKDIMDRIISENIRKS